MSTINIFKTWTDISTYLTAKGITPQSLQSIVQF